MSGANALSSLTSTANRLKQRLQENIQESARDLGLNGGLGGGASFFDSSDDRVKDLSAKLESRHDRDVLDALKRLLAMISKGRDVSSVFSSVVKLVPSSNPEIKKLSYIYLIRYAESEPDLALLSINSFQKDLNDPNPLIRAQALRVLSSIGNPMVSAVVLLGVKKAVIDKSPYVRKAGALGLTKCLALDRSLHSSLVPLLSTLLATPSPIPLGATIQAFAVLCPDRLDLLHKHYRSLCRMLVDADEWAQHGLMNVLARYARTYLSRPDEEDEEEGEEKPLDKDLELLLSKAAQLFQSRNPSVITAAVRLHVLLAPRRRHASLARPLLRLLHGEPEVVHSVLQDIDLMATDEFEIFAPYASHFFVRASDPEAVKLVKLSVLVKLVDAGNVQTVLRELKEYPRDADETFAAQSIRALGQIALKRPEVAESSLSTLIKLLRSKDDLAVTHSVLVLRSLLQSRASTATSSSTSSKHRTSPTQIVAKLARLLGSIASPSARASVYWLVGEHAAAADGDEREAFGEDGDGAGMWRGAPDVLRKGVKGFAQEGTVAKLQIILLAAKLLLLAPNHRTLRLLCRHVFALARYDLDYDVRDRARFLAALVAGVGSGVPLVERDEEDEDEDETDLRGKVVLRREQVRMVLGGEKTVVLEKITGAEKDDPELFGTLSLAVARKVPGFEPLPDWPTGRLDSSVRDEEEPTPPSTKTATPVPRNLGSVSGSPITLTPTGHGAGSPVGSFGPSTTGGAGTTRKGFTDIDDLERFFASEESSEEEEEEEPTDEESEADSESSGVPEDLVGPTAAFAEYGHEETSSDEEDEGDEDSESEDAEGEEVGRRALGAGVELKEEEAAAVGKGEAEELLENAWR